MSKAGSRILSSARQALAIAKGTAKAGTYRTHVPEELDVAGIRSKVGLSQKDFAACFGVSTRTVQEWEQRHRRPSGPARAFLTVIDREPKAVRRALSAN
ncbi:DNA-binding protein [Rhodospirillaceae bacterium LM-1]|nr:DNA-binding protein [Rhodospirillaceae bacterium LM-1]